ALAQGRAVPLREAIPIFAGFPIVGFKGVGLVFGIFAIDGNFLVRFFFRIFLRFFFRIFFRWSFCFSIVFDEGVLLAAVVVGARRDAQRAEREEEGEDENAAKGD